MEQLKIKILSWLLFHANKGSNNDAFYSIKNKILDKYAVLLRYDLQRISDKTCYSCNGTGTYANAYKIEFCYNCLGSGVYKKGFYTVLGKYYFNNYYFHKPLKKVYDKPEGMSVNINGYIQKSESKFTFLSRFLLGVLYGLDRNTLLNSNYLRVSWKVKWYYVENWLRSLLYIYCYKNFPPARDLVIKIKNFLKNKDKTEDLEELPF